MKFEFNSIQLKRNKIQIGETSIENLFANMLLEKKLEKHRFEKTPFHTYWLGSGLNIFQFETIQVVTTTFGT
jgi:hypothetical protein